MIQRIGQIISNFRWLRGEKLFVAIFSSSRIENKLKQVNNNCALCRPQYPRVRPCPTILKNIIIVCIKFDRNSGVTRRGPRKRQRKIIAVAFPFFMKNLLDLPCIGTAFSLRFEGKPLQGKLSFLACKTNRWMTILHQYWTIVYNIKNACPALNYSCLNEIC